MKHKAKALIALIILTLVFPTLSFADQNSHEIGSYTEKIQWDKGHKHVLNKFDACSKAWQLLAPQIGPFKWHSIAVDEARGTVTCTAERSGK